jgi:hypothetical protein
MTTFKDQLMEFALDVEEPYSDFQMSNFVLNTQITDYRILRQAILEIESRSQIVFTIKLAIRTNEAEIEQFDERLEVYSKKPAGKKLIQIEKERVVYDLRINKKRLLQAQSELDLLIYKVEQAYGTLENVKKELNENAEEKEKHYWVSRLAKQAAMDIVAQGRIGVGNMDAISNMDEEHQVECLATALQYNNRLQIGMQEIEKSVQAGLLENQSTLPKFDVPNITDKLMMKDKGLYINNENIQHTSQPKIKSESI